MTDHILRSTLLACLLLLITGPPLLSGCDRGEEQPPPPAAAPQQHYQGTIIALGDSLTAGLGVAENDAWPALLENRLQTNFIHWQVINAGISGETSSGALARIKWILAQKPDIVVLETGANDGLRGIPVAVIKDNIGRAVQLLQQDEVTVVLAGMQIVRNMGEEYTRAFAALYPAVAREQGCLLIPFLLEGVAGEPELNQADAIHPNEQGHRIIAQTIYPFLLQAMAARKNAPEKTPDNASF